MKTKTLRLPMLFASAGAIICTVTAVRAADAALEVREDRSTTQKEVINEPSGAERSYSTRIDSGPSSYSSQTYQSGAALDPDAEGDRIMHMYQRGRQAAEALDRQIKPNPIVVLPGSMTLETSQYAPSHAGELHQQSYSSSFNEPAAAERESTSSSTTTRRYSTSENAPEVSTSASTSTATLSAGTTMKASDLIGMNIKNEQGERIGEVKDFVVDMKSGRVAYAVVSAGGIAGLGDKWLAVPPSVFTRTGTEKTLTWDIDKEKLSSAPTIDKRNWNAAYQPEYIGNVYNFYGVQGYQQDSEVGEPAGSQKKSDSQFHHDSDKQEQGQKQGDQSRLDSSSSDLKGQAAASTESSQQSDLQKSQPEKSVSASSSSDVSKEAAGTESSSAASKSAEVPSSSSSSSSELKSSADVNAPSGSTGNRLSTEPQASSSSQVNDAAGATAGAAVSSDTESGSLPDRVQMALKNDASLSGAAENVKLSMENDKLVIKGNVKTEEEKNQILEKIRATAGSTQIDDQLKVSSSSDENK